MREHLGRAVAFLISNGFLLLLPVLPVLAALAFLDTSYLRDYRSTLRKFRVHIRAIGEGPAVTFFSTALGARTVDPEVQISGH